ncbi:MAG TPA: TetR/AcrR family transcriptional regulator [Acidimicrobiales bacterium]|jgi:AcrR family transcriptional regulator|nr:TetR/AcrR family transcriptional regulator [Acidimicrobiales bacterium]
MKARSRTSKGPAELRSDLLAAAAELFSGRGFSDVAVSDITDRAGVAAGTFYRYFPSKDDVITELRRDVFRQVLERTASVFRDPGDDGWWGAADRMIDASIRFWFEDRARSVVVLRGAAGVEGASTELALLSAFAAGLRIGQEEGAVAADLDVSVAATVLLHGSFGLVRNALMDDGHDIDALIVAVTQLAERMLKPV